jgi:hypothetical protein
MVNPMVSSLAYSSIQKVLGSIPIVATNIKTGNTSEKLNKDCVMKK